MEGTSKEDIGIICGVVSLYQSFCETEKFLRSWSTIKYLDVLADC